MVQKSKIKIYSYRKDNLKENSDREIIASVRNYISDADAGISVIRDKYGKPHIKEDCGLYVSVAHDNGLCLVAVAPFPVGIDLEREGRAIKRRGEISKRCFCKDETDFLGENMTDADFMEMWVKKEALSKLIGRGVLCMKEKSVFSKDIVFEKIDSIDGFIAYCVYYK